MLSLNSKHVPHVKINLAYNFKVNLITHLEVIALFSSNLKNVNTFFFNISQSEKRIILGSHVYRPNGTKWRNFIEDLT
jgi:hypothetical protein